MSIDTIINNMADVAVGFVDVMQDGELPAQQRPLSACFTREFLDDVRVTLVDILGLSEPVADRRAPIAAACIVLELARRQAEESELWIGDDVDAGDACPVVDPPPGPGPAVDSAGGILGWVLSPLGPSITGISGAVVWVAAGEFRDADRELGPRILVALGENIAPEGLHLAVAVTIADPPEVIGVLPDDVQRQVVEFVGRNRDALLRHWHGEIDTRELLDSLERV